MLVEELFGRWRSLGGLLKPVTASGNVYVVKAMVLWRKLSSVAQTVGATKSLNKSKLHW